MELLDLESKVDKKNVNELSDIESYTESVEESQRTNDSKETSESGSDTENNVFLKYFNIKFSFYKELREHRKIKRRLGKSFNKIFRLEKKCEKKYYLLKSPKNIIEI